MTKTRSATLSIVRSVAIIGILVFCTSAPATSEMQDEWVGTYPPTSSNNASCNLCHGLTLGKVWNSYGWHLRTSLGNGSSVAEAFELAEDVDSDLDPTGSTNIVEILAGTQPGWTEGPNNTYYFLDGTKITNAMASLGLGDLDPAPSCDEDLDSDGTVGFTDLTSLLSAWGPCPDPPAECPADFDGSGDIGFTDLTDLLSGWGDCG